MEQLGVGRSSLREAIRALVHTGLLRTRQGDGTYVRASSGLSVALQRYTQRVDAHYVLEARRGLERKAARLAATRRTERVGSPQAAAGAAETLLDWITHALEGSFGQ